MQSIIKNKKSPFKKIKETFNKHKSTYYFINSANSSLLIIFFDKTVLSSAKK